MANNKNTTIIYFFIHCDEDKNDPTTQNFTCCSQTGCTRITKLVDYFKKLGVKPDILISPIKGNNCQVPYKSQKSIQTMALLSKSFDVPILAKFCEHDTKSQAEDLLKLSGSGKTIFIAWQHSLLVEMINNVLNFKNPAKLSDYSGKRNDLIFRVTLSANESKLEVLLQNLMPNDKTTLPKIYQVFQQDNSIIFKSNNNSYAYPLNQINQLLRSYHDITTDCVCE